MKAQDIIGLVVYILAVIVFAATGNWFAAAGWAACAITQGTVMLVRKHLHETIEDLLQEKNRFEKGYNEAVDGWGNAVRLNNDILKHSQEIIDLNRELNEDNKVLGDMIVGLTSLDEEGNPKMTREQAMQLLELRVQEKKKFLKGE